jgi:adenylyltransferase/sulfurtransferase
LRELIASPTLHLSSGNTATETVFVCRLGNDSQIAADVLSAMGDTSSKDGEANIGGTSMDLIGGLRSWSRDVDAEFPIY